MARNIHFKKYIIMIGISYLFGMLSAFIAYGASGYIDPQKPYHYLYQITKSADTYESVDANADGIIDHTNADLTEILNNGYITSHDMRIDALLTTKDLNIYNTLTVDVSATINSLDANDVSVSNSLTTNDLSVSNYASINSIAGNSLSYSTGNFVNLNANDVSITNTVTVPTANVNKLCLYDESSNAYVCVDKWDDLLDILFASTP